MDRAEEIVDIDDTACVVLICTGDDGEEYVELEEHHCCIDKLQKIIKHLKQKLKYTADEVRKETAEEIYKKVDEFRKNPKLDPCDSYDCNALVAYNAVCEFIKRKYGVEVGK